MHLEEKSVYGIEKGKRKRASAWGQVREIFDNIATPSICDKNKGSGAVA